MSTWYCKAFIVCTGLEASGSGSGKGKRKAVDTDKPCKKPKLWYVVYWCCSLCCYHVVWCRLGVDEDLTDSENEEEVYADQVHQLSASQPLK